MPSGLRIAKLVRAEQGGGSAFFNDSPIGSHEAEAAYRVKTQLPAKDVAGLAFGTTANVCPVRSGQSGLLNSKLGLHRPSPLLGCMFCPIVGLSGICLSRFHTSKACNVSGV